MHVNFNTNRRNYINLLSFIPLQRYNADMLKDYLRTNGISAYALSKTSGIAYSTLNDLINGKVTVDNCRVSVLRSLAGALDLSMDQLYSICSDEIRFIRSSYDAKAALRVRAKYYYAEFKYGGDPVSLRLCKVNEENSYFIDDIVRWRVDAYIRNRRMEAFGQEDV